MSYLYIKKFLDEQIRVLNQPLVIDDALRAIMARDHISEEKMKSIVLKANIKLKRHNRYKFNKQVVHQIVQQIVKNEQEKLSKVNGALSKIDTLMQPVLLPDFSSTDISDRIRQFNALVDELPEPEYLFALVDIDELEREAETGKGKKSAGENEGSGDNEGNGEPDGSGEHARVQENESDEEILVQDDEERVSVDRKRERLEKEYQAQISSELRDRLALLANRHSELKEKYTQLRDELVSLNENLIYQQQKLLYLKNIHTKLKAVNGEKEEKLLDSENEDSESDEQGVDMDVQMKKFSILVEKLQFAMK